MVPIAVAAVVGGLILTALIGIFALLAVRRRNMLKELRLKTLVAGSVGHTNSPPLVDTSAFLTERGKHSDQGEVEDI